MLLCQEVTDGVEVLAVAGQVTGADAAPLRAAVRRAVQRGPRGVVIDLSAAVGLAPEVVDTLNWLTSEAAGWPRPALSVCCAPPELAELLLPEVRMHRCRSDAIEHIDDHAGHGQCVRVTLPADPTGPRRARQLATECALEHGVPPEDLSLVVSELVTNALRYGQPPVELEIDSCEHCVTVLVCDGGTGRPVARAADEQDEGGRGLLLVTSLASDTGVRPSPPGKAVWAELPRRSSR